MRVVMKNKEINDNKNKQINNNDNKKKTNDSDNVDKKIMIKKILFFFLVA